MRKSAIGGPGGISFLLHFGQPPLEQPDVSAEEGEIVLFEGLLKLAECAKIPSQGPTVRTRIEAADDSQPTGHLAQLPGEVAMAAEHLRIELQAFSCWPARMAWEIASSTRSSEA